MANLITWNDTFDGAPLDSESRKFGGQRIRDSRAGTSERLAMGGHYSAKHNAGSDADSLNHDGKHACGYDENRVGNEWGVYKNDLTTDALLIDEDANEIKPGPSMSFVTADGDRVDKRRKAIVWHIPGEVATGRDGVPVVECAWLNDSENADIIELRAHIETAPGTQALTVDLYRENRAGKDTAWDPSNLAAITSSPASITAGTRGPAKTTSFSVSTLDNTDVIVPYVSQVGSSPAGSDLVITLVLEW